MLYALEGSVASGVSPSEHLYCQLRFAKELSSEMAKRNLKHGVRYKVMHVFAVLVNVLLGIPIYQNERAGLRQKNSNKCVARWKVLQGMLMHAAHENPP